MVKKATTDDIIELKFPNGPRLRPSMYLGEQGKQKTIAAREIIDNAVTEILKQHATKVKVIFHKDMSIEVLDNGRGLPTDTNKDGKNGFILTMATLHAGQNFANQSVGKNGPGTNGVGGAVVNALSERFSITVFKDKKLYKLDFKEGYPGYFQDKDGYDTSSLFKAGEKIKASADTRPSKEKKEWAHGTSIRWSFDPTVGFPADEEVDIDDLVDRLRFTVYIVPGLEVEVIDETRVDEDGKRLYWQFSGDGGIREMVESINPKQTLPGTESAKGDEYARNGVFYIKTSGYYKTQTNLIDKNGKTYSDTVEREVPVEMAFRYDTGYDSNLFSFVNTIRTHMGGVHEDALKKAMVDAFNEKLITMKKLKVGKNGERPIDLDYLEGLNLVLSINVLEPQFVGQQKDRLSGPDVRRALLTAFKDAFSDFVNRPQHRVHIEAIFKKAVDAMKTRLAANAAKDLQRENRKLTKSVSMPPKLLDCANATKGNAELYICEGDSASSSLKAARDGDRHALLPIRGKIINSHKEKINKVVSNVEVQDIIKVLGAGVSADFDIEAMRYDRIFIAVDADPDGNSIATLIYALFWNLFRPVLEANRLYKVQTPLFVFTPKKAGMNKIYAMDNAEKDTIMKDLDKKGIKYSVTRLKGLGEMMAEDLEKSALNPETRVITQITLDDAAKASESLNLLFGDDTDARKRWIEETEVDEELLGE